MLLSARLGYVKPLPARRRLPSIFIHVTIVAVGHTVCKAEGADRERAATCRKQK